MMSDFKFLYGNDNKIEAGINYAKTVFDILCLGYWDADLNEPELIDGIGTNDTYYIVSVSGSVDLGSGLIEFEKYDYIKYDSSLSIWYKTNQ